MFNYMFLTYSTSHMAQATLSTIGLSFSLQS